MGTCDLLICVECMRNFRRMTLGGAITFDSTGNSVSDFRFLTSGLSASGT